MAQRRSTRSKPATTTAVRPGVRRDELVDVAARVFAAKGYGHTSIQEIADEVGILKGSLYHYIDTKEDLLFEVIRSRMVIWADLVESVRALKAPTLDRLRIYVQNNIEGSLSTLEHTTVFIHDFQALSPERQKIIVNLRGEHDQLLRGLIQDAKDEGLVSPDVNVKVVALAILSMSGSLYRWFDPSGQLPAKAVAQELTKFVLKGLGVPAERA